MRTLLYNPALIVTVNTNGKNIKRGKEMGEIGLLSDYSIIIENNNIVDILPSASIKNFSEYQIIDVTRKTILPGLVECHTHTVFAGSRGKEFRETLSGKSYEEIASSGGGINTTVTAVRNSSLEELVEISIPRINEFISQGITTLEIKSGYGLDFENEIKLLQTVKRLQEIFPITIVPTFLGAHTIPNEFKSDRRAYIDLLITKMLPFIADHKLASFCDAFCEATAFSAEEVDEIFSSADSFGLHLKLHTDQFNAVGGIAVAIKNKVSSVDHLEVVSDNDIIQLAKANITTVILPGVSFVLNHQYAPTRKLIDAGIAVALSTDYNPGSSHISSLHFIMSLSAIKMKMKIEETISAVTINAANALDVQREVGSIEIGKKADFAIFDTEEYSDIVYNVGKNLNSMTIKNGNIIFERKL